MGASILQYTDYQIYSLESEIIVAESLIVQN
jgi:hypothetical protein